MRFVNEYRERFGVEPICDTLQVAPSTYYAALSRPPSVRQQRDRELKVEIARVHQENFDVYGTEKVWKQLRRESFEVGRDRVGRLMAELELEGAVRGKTWRTTIPSAVASRPADLVDRDFSATAPPSGRPGHRDDRGFQAASPGVRLGNGGAAPTASGRRDQPGGFREDKEGPSGVMDK